MARADYVFEDRRTERLHVRVSSDFKARLEQAAQAAHVNASDLVVSAVNDRVTEILASKTVVDADYFDRLIDALDAPPAVLPRLAEAARRRAARA